MRDAPGGVARPSCDPRQSRACISVTDHLAHTSPAYLPGPERALTSTRSDQHRKGIYKLIWKKKNKTKFHQAQRVCSGVCFSWKPFASERPGVLAGNVPGTEGLTRTHALRLHLGSHRWPCSGAVTTVDEARCKQVSSRAAAGCLRTRRPPETPRGHRGEVETLYGESE